MYGLGHRDIRGDILSNPRAKRGDWVMKMAVRVAIVSRRRKDFGGARILAARKEAWEGAQGEKRGGGAGQGISSGVVRPSVVCLSSVRY